MLNAERYATAVRFAVNAHRTQVRKGTTIPYFTHPLAVSGLVLEFGGDEEQAIAGLLHDVVEDCDLSPGALAEIFGSRVAAIVEGCTDGTPDENGRKAPWSDRKQRYLIHLQDAEEDVLLVSACDKLHNARSIVRDLHEIGAAVFDRFTAGREQTLWYYSRLADTFEERLAQRDLARALAYEVGRMSDRTGVR
jgi:(p)ppGpp synthase/HD superfamily hydrolase